jgi:N-acetylglucosaminyldiphosphoundecaprenol N-acetyl-beta-D-mannosaminyltransferase
MTLPSQPGQTLTERTGLANSPRCFLGIPFWSGDAESLLQEADFHGGLLTVPSAPSLAEMSQDPFLRQAYAESDWAVMDGGYVALVLRFLYRRRWPRISGLQLLERLLGTHDHARAIPFEKRRVLWVMPSLDEEARVRNLLESLGFEAAKQKFYQAPVYRQAEDYDDAELAERVGEFQPDWVVLGIGGGKQEKLGLRLREALRRDERTMPVILCTGGAIAFLSGGQARIPVWADRMYLGWFLRILDNPRTFVSRYWKAGWQFPRLLWKEQQHLFEPRPASRIEPTLVPPIGFQRQQREAVAQEG